MRIENLFEQDIFRSITGVVKADQLDDASVWQELDEFVVTSELSGHFDRFFSCYGEAIDGSSPEVAGSIGVWISGFFGSGKSHFLKVLSYLLANRANSYEGKERRAVEFFESKIADALLFGDIKRAVATDTDVILFNIDNKADTRTGRDAILAVFLKVLNEMQGFSGDHPHIAHLERYLSSKGKLQAFHDAFRSSGGGEWLDERDAYGFHRDEVVKALAQTLDQSAASCEKWIDGAEERFALTVENLAKWVKEYLDSQSSAHRIIFLVDEVGQFIGDDPHLMLNLQTITEALGAQRLAPPRTLTLAPGTRHAYLDRVCGDEPALRAEVESLLASDAEASPSFLGAPVDPPEPTLPSPPAAGKTVGAYRLVERLGEGGMGTVYLVVRADGTFERQVGVKVLRAGLTGRPPGNASTSSAEFWFLLALPHIVAPARTW